MAPVKGMGLHSVTQLDVGVAGAQGDRVFVVADARCHLVNGKRLGLLVQITAALENGLLHLGFPGGVAVSAVPQDGPPGVLIAYGRERPAAPVIGPWREALSDFAGMEVQLMRPLLPGDGIDRRRRGAVTLLGEASLASLAAGAGWAALDARRFRMTVGLEGLPAYAEEAWIGGEVAVGEAVIAVGGHVGRCAVTTQDPDTGRPDLTTLHQLRAQRSDVETDEPLPFGVWGSVVQPGRIHLGDPAQRLA